MLIVGFQLAGQDAGAEWDSVSDLTSSFAKVSYFTSISFHVSSTFHSPCRLLACLISLPIFDIAAIVIATLICGCSSTVHLLEEKCLAVGWMKEGSFCRIEMVCKHL